MVKEREGVNGARRREATCGGVGRRRRRRRAPGFRRPIAEGIGWWSEGRGGSALIGRWRRSLEDPDSVTMAQRPGLVAEGSRSPRRR